jgi:hypothetical protein
MDVQFVSISRGDSCLSLLNQDEIVVLSSPGSDLDPAGIGPGNLKQLAAGFGGSISPDFGAWGVRFRSPPFWGISGRFHGAVVL